MQACTRRGFRIMQVRVERLPGGTDDAARALLELEGPDDSARLTSDLFQEEGVLDMELIPAADEE